MSNFKDATVTILQETHEKNPIVILGSSRSDGNTLRSVNAVIQGTNTPIIDLKEFQIAYYDYENRNESDDFMPIAERMMGHDTLILATPVYWYSMSAIMKTFIDRWSDFVDFRKDLGRGLAGKELYLIASYAGQMPKGFEEPFFQTCEYLKMNYGGCLYYYSGVNEAIKQKNESLVHSFSEKIFNHSALHVQNNSKSSA